MEEQILIKAQKIRRQILADSVLANDIDNDLEIIPAPFKGKHEIKIIIIGQDPTVRDKKTRPSINTVLMLNNPNSNLFQYINTMTLKLNLTLDNIYATNFYKCFFSFPPADDERIFTRHFRYWFDLLMEEINTFPDAGIITLGEQVLKQLIHTGNNQVNYFWDYLGNIQSGGKYKPVEANCNLLNRKIYPLPHIKPFSQNDFCKPYYDD